MDAATLTSPEPQPIGYKFGLFEVDLKAEELQRSGRRIRLQGQPFRVLVILLEYAGEVVSRDEIQRRLWDPNTTVDFDHSLGIAINKLREALGDSADNPRYIETLPRRGYRFIAPVMATRLEVQSPEPVTPLPLSTVSVDADSSNTKSNDPQAWYKLRSSWRAGVALVAIVLLFSALAYFFGWLRSPAPKDPPRISSVVRNGHVMSSQLDVENFSSMAVDGGHIYFSQLEDGRLILAQALTANGEVQSLRLPSDIVSPLICALSPDGTRLIVRSHLARKPEQSLWIVSALGGQAFRFAGGLAHDATWMPDGQHILYASGNAIFVARDNGQENQHLVDLPGRAFWLRWSPDGQRLRMTIIDAESGTPSLWEYDAANHRTRPLAVGQRQLSSTCCGSWTPDGRYYVFQSYSDGFTDIWRMRGSGADGNPLRLTNGPLEFQSPAMGPGSNRVFFTGTDYRREMLVYSSAEHRFLPLINNLGSAALIDYSRDRKWVAWLNASDNTLWRSRVDGTERLQLTTTSMPIFSIKWSPDDQSLLLMARKAGKQWAIYVIDANGGNLRLAVEDSKGQADPNWFGDGNTILFGRVPDPMGGSETDAKSLLKVNLQTHTIEKIPGSEGMFSPRLSPDERYIAALSLDQKKLMLFDTASQRWTTIVDGGASDPVWSSDSRALFFQNFLEPGEPVYRIEIASGVVHQVATLADLLPADALDYRLVALAPGDYPIVSTQSSSVNIYSLEMN